MNAKDLQHAVDVLREGGIVAYPTESCYGLGCDPRRHAAVRRLLYLKQRPWQKGLILIADRYERFASYIAPLDPTAQKTVTTAWPGPVTWLLPARQRVSPWLRGAHMNIAVRVTAHPGATALCRHARSAIVSTSANRQARPPARSAEAVRREFGDQIDYILSGNIGSLKRPTQIRDVLTGEVIRPG